ncbi:uncharacterized protein LOC113238693, partial [Hyposmocoma kahamanoa]|uniref:uncharacterized protein LOC113238693 n=1 Tax=Hyposmocoma kahamanoa TaxID=1477025 RepID=UPI000E6D7CA6
MMTIFRGRERRALAIRRNMVARRFTRCADQDNITHFKVVRKTMRYRRYKLIIAQALLYLYMLAFGIFAILWIGVMIYVARYIRDLKPERYIPQSDVIARDIEIRLAEALKVDNGTGCQIPKLDPFSPEIMIYDKNLPHIVCKKLAWVRCHLFKCKVTPKIFKEVTNIECFYHDIIYVDDLHFIVNRQWTQVIGNGVYFLKESDHIMADCFGVFKNVNISWRGVAAGFRSEVEIPPPVPLERDHTINVLIFGFDSASRNGFIRKMPNSYNFLKLGLNATILTG